jgi:hypothetical protein
MMFIVSKSANLSTYSPILTQRLQKSSIDAPTKRFDAAPDAAVAKKKAVSNLDNNFE